MNEPVAGKHDRNNEEIAHTDPVCHMSVLPSKAAAKHEHAGTVYYFCNPQCLEKFRSAPQDYLNTDHSAKAQMPAAEPTEEERLKTFYANESSFDYVCPMHPEVRQSNPGDCPLCGMPLESALPSASEQEGQIELKEAKKRFFLCAVLTVCLLSISMPAMFGLSLPFLSSPQGHLNAYLQLFLASPVVAYGGAPIFKRAIDSASHGHMNMFTLISFGVFISYTVSCLVLLLHLGNSHDLLYFESAATIVTLVLLGQILELKTRNRSKASLESLFALAPSLAKRRTANLDYEEIPVYQVKRGDILQVLAGDKLPADGTVIEGESSIDESLLSGNSLPVRKTAGQKVYAGTINQEGSLLMQADSLGRDTLFAQIIQLLSNAQNSRSPIQEFADRVSSIFIPAVLGAAAVTFCAWYFLGGKTGLSHAIKDTISVLVIACPCALGLATPIAVSAAVARAGKLGLLVKDARALEMLATASHMLIDKTGTLTRGDFELIKVECLGEFSQEDSLRIAAAVEQESKHPLAQAICRQAQTLGLRIPKAEKPVSHAGMGIYALVDGKITVVGSARFMREHGVSLDTIYEDKQNHSSGSAVTNEGTGSKNGATSIFLGVSGKLAARFLLADKLKEESVQFIADLKTLSVQPQIISGDSKDSVAAAALELKIDPEQFSYSLMPQDKVAQVQKLRAEGNVVAMLGDGINDAAALAAADAGIAMSTGSDVAVTSAPLTALTADLRTISKSIKLARKTQALMKENLFLAFAYNVLALILASGLLYPFTGLELSPGVAAAAMSLSSLSVIFNSLRLTNMPLK